LFRVLSFPLFSHLTFIYQHSVNPPPSYPSNEVFFFFINQVRLIFIHCMLAYTFCTPQQFDGELLPPSALFPPPLLGQADVHSNSSPFCFSLSGLTRAILVTDSIFPFDCLPGRSSFYFFFFPPFLGGTFIRGPNSSFPWYNYQYEYLLCCPRSLNHHPLPVPPRAN